MNHNIRRKAKTLAPSKTMKRKALNMVDVPRKVCGTILPIHAHAKAKFCSLKCKQVAGRKPGSSLWTSWQRRRKEIGLTPGPMQMPCVGDLIQRDGLACHICLKPIDYALHWMDKRSLTVDHIIPVADPRSFHALENLKLAHRRCNEVRNNALANDKQIAA